MTKVLLKLDGRVWINAGNLNFVGDGKIHLLEKIAELGSLRKASIEMKMSYRQAWEQVNKMNKAAQKPVVILHRGGKDGGVAELTDFGKQIIRIQQELHAEFQLFLQKQSEKLAQL